MHLSVNDVQCSLNITYKGHKVVHIVQETPQQMCILVLFSTTILLPSQSFYLLAICLETIQYMDGILLRRKSFKAYYQYRQHD